MVLGGSWCVPSPKGEEENKKRPHQAGGVGGVNNAMSFLPLKRRESMLCHSLGWDEKKALGGKRG